MVDGLGVLWRRTDGEEVTKKESLEPKGRGADLGGSEVGRTTPSGSNIGFGNK